MLTETEFASRLLKVCLTAAGWVPPQILDRLKGADPIMPPHIAASYLDQIRRALDDIEKDATP